MAEGVDYILDIPGVDGEYLDEHAGGKYDGKIRIESWSFGASNPGTWGQGTSGGGSKGTPHDFVISKFVDKSTAPLLEAALENTLADKTIKFVERKQGKGEPVETIVLEMNKCVIADVSFSGSGDSSMETVTINFKDGKITYTPTDEDGAAGTAVPRNIKRSG